MIRNRILIVFLLIVVFCGQTKAQQGDYAQEQIETYKIKAKDQVKFLVYMLNTLGNEHTSPRDKDVIIRESYKKIFRDAKVQIEDDLSENRTVITNKDVTAYLKDIEFFFRQVKFEFDIKEMEAFTRDNGELSFKIAVNRTLKATGLEGEVILNTKLRYIEINLDKETDELAIASIYTTKVSRDVALKEWWKTLSFGWKTILKEKLSITADSISISMLNTITALDSINLSGNASIISVEPLTMLVDLKHINLSKTYIDDIAPLSSLNGLTSLNISNTSIEDISYLRYAENIKKLDLSYTRVSSLEPLNNLQQLESLSIAGSNVNEFTILKFFPKLQTLNLAETNFGQLSILEDFKALKSLNLSRTNISSFSGEVSPGTLENLDLSFTAIKDITKIGSYNQLKTLNISSTQVSKLASLTNNKVLEKVYADNTLISESDAADFKDLRPNVIVVINSVQLSAWWLALNDNWKKILKTYIPPSKNEVPTKEQLAKLISIDSLNVADQGLNDIAPLKKFLRLRSLNISNNTITSFDELASLASLSHLSASHSGMKITKPLLGLNKLRKLDLSGNPLTSEEFLKLANIKNLKLLNVDDSGVKKQMVSQFRDKIGNDCIVIFDSKGVTKWWGELDNRWKGILKLQLTLNSPPTSKELHQLIALRKMAIVDEEIVDLYPLEQFVQLETIFLERINLSDLESLKGLGDIKSLTIKFSPITSIASLGEMTSLVELNLNNTAVEDLRPLENMNQLLRLSVAGSKVDDLKGLEQLYNLQTLDISSTQIKKLKRLSELIYLSKLTCFNTRISSREVEKFKENHPVCEILYY
jgi:hypothetical protein